MNVCNYFKFNFKWLKYSPSLTLQVISLENFDECSTYSLTSPRSIEACKRQGIEPSELLYLPFDQFKETIKDEKVDQKLLKALWERYNERRKDKIKIVHEVNVIK